MLEFVEAVKNGLTVKPQVTGAAVRRRPEESLPGREDLRPGSGLDEAWDPIGTQWPVVEGIGSHYRPSSPGKIRAVGGDAGAIGEEMDLGREIPGRGVVLKRQGAQPGLPQLGQGGRPEGQEATSQLSRPGEPVRGKGLPASRGGRAGFKAMCIAVRGLAVATGPGVGEVAGVLP